MPKDVGADWTATTDKSTDNADAAATDPKGAPSFERAAASSAASSPTARRYRLGLPRRHDRRRVLAAHGVQDRGGRGRLRHRRRGEFAAARRAGARVRQRVRQPDAVASCPSSIRRRRRLVRGGADRRHRRRRSRSCKLQIVIVAFRKGNVNGRRRRRHVAAHEPATRSLTPYVDLVLQRIAANQ